MRNHFLNLPILVFIIVSPGCTPLVSRQFVAESERPPHCQLFFDELDGAVDADDVRDASAAVVPGFPYLRANRFLASFTDQLTTEDQKQQWVQEMHRLDLETRKKEIHNLSLSAIKAFGDRFGESFNRDALLEKTTAYSEKLLAHDQRHPDFYAALKRAVEIPDEYSTGLRVVGLYPITSMPVAAVTRKVYAEFRQWHQLPRSELATIGALRVYGPAEHLSVTNEQISRLWDRSKRNALGMPILSDQARQKLLRIYAPVFLQDLAADYDEIGEVYWDADRVAVNSMAPSVYYYFSNARFKGAPILQINYVVWYSARDGPHSPRIERGRLDGITVRISLDTNGHPFMVDIMNNCGCYHFFIPLERRVQRILPSPQALDAFVPRWLPERFPERRLSIRVKTGWHQVDNIDAIRMPSELIPYQLVPYEQLEMLPQDGLRSESLFDSMGIAKNSERIEPLIFFPMGIRAIGSMRQRGHHAIKFVGRAHFDDPHIFDDNFEFR